MSKNAKAHKRERTTFMGSFYVPKHGSSGRRFFHETREISIVINLQVMLQNGNMRIAKDIKNADALIGELINLQAKVIASGHDVYGGTSGVPDNLALSVAMLAWLAERRKCKSGMKM